MMKNYYIYMYGFLLLLLGGLPACTKEIGGDDSEIVTPPDIDENTELEAVTIRIGAAETAETKAMHGDENAVEGEFIYSLHLFIVDDQNVITKHIAVTSKSEDLSAEQQAEAAIGNLPQYSTTIDIMPGIYTFYAFANMEHAMISGNENMETKLSALAEGGTWTDLSSVVINNPAANVDIASGNYIPMSVSQTFDLSADGQRISLSLVRLVAKVRATLTNKQGKDVEISALSMNGLASSVPLFKQESLNNPAGNNPYTYKQTFTPSVTIANDGEHTFADFYVNETTGGGMNLSLTIDGVEYQGLLTTQSLERNHVLPVALNLSNQNLVLDITAQVAPIGGYPVEVVLGDPSLTENYAITLPEGCTFSIEGAFQPQAGDPINITEWLWSLPEENTIVGLLDPAGDAIPLEGYVTALPGQTATLKFTVSQPNRLTGTLTITTEEVGDEPWQGNTRSLTQWGEAPRWYEAVGLVKHP